MGILDQLQGQLPPGILATLFGQQQQPPQQGVMSGAMPPAQPMAMPPSPQQPQAPPPSAASPFFSALGSGLHNNSNALLGFAGGTLSGGIGKGFTAAVAGSEEDRKERLERQQNDALTATYEALKARGIPATQARAMAQNPAYLDKNLLGVQPQQHVMQTDLVGNQVPMSFDPATGKYRGQDGNPVQPQGAASDTGPLPTGQAYLDKYVPKEAHNEIKQIANYEQSGSGRNLQKLMPLVANFDPTFDQSIYPARVALRKSYMGGGPDFKETQALNTVGGHLGRLMDSAEGLGNSDWKPWNWAKNLYADTVKPGGSPELVKFRNDLVTTQNELAKAYHGGHVSDSAYNAFSKAIGESQTPGETKAAIGELSGLLQSKIEAKESGYRYGMGKAPIPAEFKAINDEALHSFQRINDWASGKPKAGATPAAGWSVRAIN